MADGVLTALVYRTDWRVTVLDVSGDPPELEPFAASPRGGDWDEVQILFEDAPPQPPKEPGLWELSWPWHRLTPEERETEGDMLCCIYEGKPQWQKMKAVPALTLLRAPNQEGE